MVLEATAKKADGTEIFREERIYMPVPLQFGRGGDRMGRGPYEKSGLIEDTGLPVGRTVTERFEFPLPAGGEGKGDVAVTFRLLYLPFGKNDESAVPWRETTVTLAPPNQVSPEAR